MIASENRKLRAHLGHALGAGGFLAPILSVVSPAALTPLCIGAAMAVLAIDVLRDGRVPRLGKWVGWPMALLLAYAVVSSAWAIRPIDTLLMWPLVTAVFCAGLILVDAVRRLNSQEWRFACYAFVFGLVLGVALLALETTTHAKLTFFLREVTQTTSNALPEKYSKSWFNRAATIMVLMLWPAVMLALRESRAWLAGAFVLLLVLTINQTGSASALAAATVGTLVFAIAWALPHRAPLLFALILGAGMLFAPLIVYGGLATPKIAVLLSHKVFSHRLRIWDHSVELISQKPVLGWGLDSARYLKTGGSGTGATAELMPLHPHNGPLQIWLELGLVGAAIAAALAVTTCLAIGRLIADRAQRAGCLAAVASAVTIICLSYGIWQYWWLSGLWLTAALTLAVALGDNARGTADQRVAGASSGPRA